MPHNPSQFSVSLPSALERIVLIGFMGAGKSTVGRLLADQSGRQFHDLDDEVSARAEMSVPQIFARHGEAHFRNLEAEALHQLLVARHVVLALGGGTLESAATRDALTISSATAVVYLESPFDVLLARCAEDPSATTRPLIADRAEAQRRFDARVPFYLELQHLTVSAATQSPHKIAEAIGDGLHKLYSR